MFGSLRVARIFGIDIEIHLSWVLILGLLSWTLSEQLFPDQYEHWSRAAYWAIGTSAAVLLFVTVLIHELAHALVARRRGLPVPRITLFIFGGVSHMERQPQSAGEEFAIAAAGPATSIVIAVVTFALGFTFYDVSDKLSGILLYLGFVNAALAVFNILPGFPLDGGRVLRSIAWKRTGSFRRATVIASSVGQTFAYGLLLTGVFILLAGFTIDGIWLLFIGWFLLNAARAEAEGMQLEAILGRLSARDVMNAEFETVSPAISLQQVVDDHMLARGERAVVVADERGVLGMLTVSDVRRVPREKWASTPAQATMTPRERVTTVEAGARALDVLRLVSERRVHQIPVLADGRMIGMVTRRDLLDRLQLAESLAPDAPSGPDSGAPGA